MDLEAAELEEPMRRGLGVRRRFDCHRRQVAAAGYAEAKPGQLEISRGIALHGTGKKLSGIEGEAQPFAAAGAIYIGVDTRAETGFAQSQQGRIERTQRQLREAGPGNLRPRPGTEQQCPVDGMAPQTLLPQSEQLRFARDLHGG